MKIVTNYTIVIAKKEKIILMNTPFKYNHTGAP